MRDSIAIAYKMASISQDAYGNSKEKRQQVDIITSKITNCWVKCYLINRDYGELIVAFKGTTFSNLMEWLSNFSALPVGDSLKVHEGCVHEGFLIAFNSVKDRIEKALNKNLDTVQDIYFTGHSRGGAIAVLAADYFKKRGYPVKCVYTFGSPQVGDVKFSRQYMVPHFRYEYGRDIVPFLPDPSWGIVYRHTGELRYMDQEGSLTKRDKRCGEAQRLAKISDRDFANWEESFKENLRDHKIDKYVEAIEKNLIFSRVDVYRNEFLNYHFPQDYLFPPEEEGLVPAKPIRPPKDFPPAEAPILIDEQDDKIVSNCQVNRDNCLVLV
ncbi:MAG: lipase family protein [Symploca sp. SIO3C6]|nr:lipase family protein [Symploca sp. SIO3C6]